MSSAQEHDPEERILVLASSIREGEITQELLVSAGLPAKVCRDLEELAACARTAAGAVLLTDETARSTHVRRLLTVFDEQPPWSELPLIIITQPGATSPETAELLKAPTAVTVLERPMRVRSLISTLHAAICARRRQYQLRAQMEEIRRAAEETQALMDAVPTPVFVARDARGDEIIGNRAACEFLRQPVGANLSASAPGDKCLQNFVVCKDGMPVPPDQLPIQMTARDGQERRNVELDVVFDDGTVRHLVGHTAPLHPPDGGPRGAVAAMLDLTDLVRANQERIRLLESEKAARAEAERANRAKDQFIAVLSHELRTPLTPALTMVQLLERERYLPQAMQDALGIIRRSPDLEIRLIDDLLDVNRLARGKIQLQRSIVDLHALLAATTRAIENDARAKRITVTCDFAAQQHHARVDSARMQQVFWNILKNAVKFTPDGGSITLRTSKQDDHIAITCSDTGVGISAATLPRIFDAFEQGGKSVARMFGGLGLGLAISKTLVEAHGGTIEAESPGVGHGATFTIRLPATPPSEPVIAPEGSPSRAVSGGVRHAARILLVEDHADTAAVLSRLLRSWGYSVRTADSVATALQAIHAEPFDILISDIGLPDGSGVDLMRMIRPTFPIRGIVLSGFGMEEDIRQSRAAGFEGHLTKPVDMEQLQSTVAELASQREPMPV